MQNRKQRLQATVRLLLALLVMEYVFQIMDPLLKKIDIFSLLETMDWLSFSLVYVSALLVVLGMLKGLWMIAMWMLKQWSIASKLEED